MRASRNSAADRGGEYSYGADAGVSSSQLTVEIATLTGQLNQAKIDREIS